MNTRLIEHKFNALPNDYKREVVNFIDFPMTKQKHKTISSQFNFTWEGGLSEFKDKYNAVDLQYQSLEWR